MNKSFTNVAASLAMAAAPAAVLAQQPTPASEIPHYRLAVSTNYSCSYVQDNKNIDLKTVTVMINDLNIPKGLPGAGATLPKGTAIFEYKNTRTPVVLDAKGHAVIGPGNHPAPVVTDTMRQDATALNRDCVTQVAKFPGAHAWTANP